MSGERRADSTPDPHDTAVTMRATGYCALACLLAFAIAGVTLAGAVIALGAMAAVVVILLADEVEARDG